ncbi:hypothetical protein FGB62_230g09 [Gracilaria domingensis]|nr:hypothetical protein FGB62_230g09 [Gracilaria domingensis]
MFSRQLNSPVIQAVGQKRGDTAKAFFMPNTYMITCAFCVATSLLLQAKENVFSVWPMTMSPRPICYTALLFVRQLLSLLIAKVKNVFGINRTNHESKRDRDGHCRSISEKRPESRSRKHEKEYGKRN